MTVYLIWCLTMDKNYNNLSDENLVKKDLEVSNIQKK
jgi:hypothetical protein